MRRTGFTLIELLIVVVIIGVLAAIAIPKFANSKQKAYVTAMKSDLRSLVAAQLNFFVDKGTYTDDVSKLSFKQSTGVSLPTITLFTRAYTATVTHAQVPDMVCAIGVNTANPLLATAGQGEAICQ